MNFEKARRAMVEDQLIPRGIRDEKVLDAMGKVERHLFVDEEIRNSAYDDCALPIGEGQTISQPYMVALMTELLELKGAEKVLEIGTGSGYQTAVLSLLAAEVYSVERIGALSIRARKVLLEQGYANTHLIVSDGTIGLPEYAPYDSIIVTAGAPEMPDNLLEQLSHGNLVIPVGSRYSQTIYIFKKTADGLKQLTSTACVFVPLVGEKGWRE